MQTWPLVIGVILLIIGVIGLLYSYAVVWMWILVALGVIGIIWGLSGKELGMK